MDNHPPVSRRLTGQPPRRQDAATSLEDRIAAMTQDDGAPPTAKLGGRTKAVLGLAALAGGVALARKGGVGPVLSGIGAASRSLEESGNRERRRTLEELVLQDREADRKREAESHTLDMKLKQRRLDEPDGDYDRVQAADGAWYMVNRRDPDDVRPVRVDGSPLKGRVPNPPAPRQANPTAETPEARDNRRAADRDRLAANTTAREIAALKRELGQYPQPTPENKAKQGRLKMLEARRDSLQGEHDKHSSAANRAALGGSKPTNSPSSLQQELGAARKAYEASLAAGRDSATAKALYDRVVQAIRAKHSTP